MKDINKVILVGRLGADPIRRSTKTGTPVTHFSMVTTRKFYKEGSQNKENQLTEVPQWHRIVAWGKQAEACSAYLKKGHAVYVEGSIQSHSYTDKDGQSKTSFEIQAESVSFLNGKSPNIELRSPPIAESREELESLEAVS